MKKQIYRTASTMILLAICAVAPAKAQLSTLQMRVSATIPFAFSVGNRTLPAGEYSIVSVNSTSEPTVLQFRSKDRSASVLVQTRPTLGKASETAKLVFTRYGDQYYFAQAWLPNDKNGIETPKSRAERASQNDLARSGKASEQVAVRAR